MHTAPPRPRMLVHCATEGITRWQHARGTASMGCSKCRRQAGPPRLPHNAEARAVDDPFDDAGLWAREEPRRGQHAAAAQPHPDRQHEGGDAAAAAVPEHA